MSSPQAGSVHCVTCSDEGVMVRVIARGEEPGTAICRAASGPDLVVNVELVDGAGSGDELLVHAGVALRRFPGAESRTGCLPDAASRFPFSDLHCFPTPRNH